MNASRFPSAAFEHSAEHVDILQKLDKMLTEHMIKTNDSWDIEAKFPPPNFQSHADGAKYAEELAKVAVVEK